MRELEITVSLRNNRLKERRLALGFTVRDMAIAIGCVYSSYAGLEAMRTKPDRNGRWRPLALQIAEYFDVDVEELFPIGVREVSKPKGAMKADAYEALELIGIQKRPDEALEDGDIKRKVRNALATLTPREEKVLRMRFGIDGHQYEHTNDEVGIEIGGVTRERVRQIQAKAIRKLLHPSQGSDLIMAADGIEYGEWAKGQK